jgi:hypothetical protein
MGRWMLTNGNGFDVFPESDDDLLRGLTEIDELARRDNRPRIAVLTSDAEAQRAPYLSIGLGAPDSVLVFEQGDDEQGGYSRGPRVGDVSEVSFAYGTGSSEYLGWMLIAKQTAIAAAVEFFRTGKQPTSVDWDDTF